MGEPSVNQDVRSKKVLDGVFGSDDATWVSVTSHSGEIASLLRGERNAFIMGVVVQCLGFMRGKGRNEESREVKSG